MPCRNNNRSSVSSIGSPDAHCVTGVETPGARRLVDYAARPALRLMHEHIKPIHPYLDVGFSVSRLHACGSKRRSQVIKLQPCPLRRARQRTCAGGLHVDTKTQHLVPPILKTGWS